MGVKWTGVVLVGLVCACAAAAPEAQNASTSPSTPPAIVDSPQPGPTPASPPAPTPIPVIPAAFSCRLPITLLGGPVRSGGFIDFPSGSFTPDPASAQVNSINRPGRELVDQAYSLYFDRAYLRWLP